MRLATFLINGRSRWGAVEGDRIKPLDSRWADLRTALCDGVLEIASAAADAEATVALIDVQLLPPVPKPEKIFAIGVNFRSHRNETGRAASDHPAVFVRFADAQVGSGQPIVRPFLSDKFDFEAEVAVIMGREGRHIPVSEALEFVAGYSCFADNSVRDFQRHTNQATPGKNFDASGAFGPWLVTTDEIGDPSALELTGRLNGERVQHSSLDDLIFSVPDLIAYISSFTKLRPGDVIATGTPSGVGMKRSPPLFLRPGDVFEVEVSGIGVLRNHVVDEEQPRHEKVD